MRMPWRLRRKRRKQKRWRHWDPCARGLLWRSQAPQVLPCLAKASNRPCTSRTVEAAATTTQDETRVYWTLEVEAAKVIKETKILKSKATIAVSNSMNIKIWAFKSVILQFCMMAVNKLRDCFMKIDFISISENLLWEIFISVAVTKLEKYTLLSFCHARGTTWRRKAFLGTDNRGLYYSLLQ